jgi:type II secretory pathway component PulK
LLRGPRAPAVLRVRPDPGSPAKDVGMYASSTRRDKRQSRPGSVLILVLIVLSSMTALSVGLAHRTRIELQLAQANATRVQAYYLALGGLERVKTLLSAVETLDAESRLQAVAGLNAFAGTADQENLFEQVPEFAAREGRALSYAVRDELGYFHVNRSDPAAWENLGLLGREHVAGILDWIDADDDTGPGGAESDVYLRLATPYVAKNRPCGCLKELLLVRGVDRQLYAGAVLSRCLQPAQERDDAASLFAPGAGGTVETDLLHVFTVCGAGRINLNTAAPALLAALPGLDETAAAHITAWQAGPDGVFGTQDDRVIANAADLAKIEGLTPQQVDLLGEYGCFESQFFRVLCRARFGPHVQCCLMATIHSGQDRPQVLHVERLL